MSLLNPNGAWPGLCVLQRELVAWGKTEGMGWVYVLKTTVAVLLALGVSLRLEFGQPVTAMVTVYIIMPPQTGLVLTKSFYRICGTLAGTLASLALLGLFAQERALFLLGLSVWIGLCTAGAALYRNFKSYGFTLAGYSAAMISLPLVMQPAGFFDFAVNRASEVVVGILCAGVVSGIIFPRSLGDSIVQTIQGRYVEFMLFVQAALSGKMESREIDSMHLRLIANVVNLESLRSSVSLEASEIRTHDHKLRRINRDFMSLSTTFHSLYQLLNRLKKAGVPAAGELVSLSASLADALATGEGPARNAEEAQQAARRIAAFRAKFSPQVAAIRLKYSAFSDKRTNLDCETALELINRFDRELHDYTRTYASLVADRQVLEPLEGVRFATRTDPVLALLTGARTTAVILLVSAFWIATAWPNGASAVMMAAIVSALFASAPDPVRAVRMALVGNLAGFAAGLLCKFILLPNIDGFGLLCAGVVPFLLIGPHLTLHPKLATAGLGYSTMFCFMVSPTNSMQYDPVGSTNFGSALMLGVASAAVIFATFAPVTGVWFKRRTAVLLRRQVEMACFGPLANIAHRFESSTRDILQRLAAQQNVEDPNDRNILDWMFIVLEIGRAIIHLRQDVESASFPQPLFHGVRNTIESTAQLFNRPNAQRHSFALDIVENCIETVFLASEQVGICEKPREVLRRVLTSLNLIRVSLLDDETILAAMVAGPQSAFQGETFYAS